VRETLSAFFRRRTRRAKERDTPRPKWRVPFWTKDSFFWFLPLEFVSGSARDGQQSCLLLFFVVVVFVFFSLQNTRTSLWFEKKNRQSKSEVQKHWRFLTFANILLSAVDQFLKIATTRPTVITCCVITTMMGLLPFSLAQQGRSLLEMDCSL